MGAQTPGARRGVTRRLVLTLFIGAAAAVWPAEALAVSNTSSGDGVPPQIVPGNPADCATAGISGATTLTYNSSQSGTASDGNGASVVVTSSDGTTFSFSATLPSGQMILGVLAKGGDQGGNLYDYRTLAAGGVLTDSNLHPPPTGNGDQFAGISHIIFCYGTPSSKSGGGGGGGGGTNTPTAGTPSNTTTTTTAATTPTTAVKAITQTKHKKHKKHKKHHVKAKVISRPPKVSSGFTG